MSDSDTVKLLRECNSGIQMAVFSIDEILEKVTDKNLYEILKKSKEKHEKLGDMDLCMHDSDSYTCRIIYTDRSDADRDSSADDDRVCRTYFNLKWS